MITRRSGAGRRSVWHSGFTLIELLVVVAIIALLISILLPSLSKARAQARTTLCASRLAQMIKAMLIYADDFNETPPFILKAAGDDAPEFADTPSAVNNRKETWLAAASTMEHIFLEPESNWYSDNDPHLPESGDLFKYARFTSLYLCPEFERVNNPNKDQNVFNFTRSFLGRKLDVDALLNGFTKHWLQIIKISAMYSTATMPMMIDESWSNYVAWPEPYGYTWAAHDPIADLLDSCMGQYHGAPIQGYVWRPNTAPGDHIVEEAVKMASVGYYDAHVELVRDPVPNLEHNGGRAPLNPFAGYGRDYLRWIGAMLYAQQGLALPNF